MSYEFLRGKGKREHSFPHSPKLLVMTFQGIDDVTMPEPIAFDILDRSLIVDDRVLANLPSCKTHRDIPD
jgi:hypothetical protein